MTIVALDDPRWVSFVEQSSDATAFHHPQWGLLLSAAWRYRAFALALEASSGDIQAGLPIIEVAATLGRPRWVALPFTDACPPLAENGRSRELLVAELDAARISARVAGAEVRAAVSGEHAHQHTAGVIHRLGIGGDASALSRQFTHEQFRRNVRRAQRSGLRVRHGRAPADIASFYELHLKTRRRQGIPIQPLRFFRLLWEYILRPGLGFVSVVEDGQRPIAAAVFLSWNGTLIYKYGASDPERLQKRPNHLVFWDALQWSCDHGIHTVDFGRTDLENEGLRQFKGGWGAREEPLVYTTLADNATSHPRGQIAGLVLQPLIRHTPPWVCRALGELLYRRAA